MLKYFTINRFPKFAADLSINMNEHDMKKQKVIKIEKERNLTLIQGVLKKSCRSS